MKKFSACLLTLLIALTMSFSTVAVAKGTQADSANETKVSGYTRKDGTKVAGYTRKKPGAKTEAAEKQDAPAAAPPDKSAAVEHVKGYTKKDGTKVAGYTRKKSSK